MTTNHTPTRDREQEWSRSYSELKARHDELVAALRGYLEADVGPMGSGDREIALHRARTIARAALAKVEA